MQEIRNIGLEIPGEIFKEVRQGSWAIAWSISRIVCGVLLSDTFIVPFGTIDDLELPCSVFLKPVAADGTSQLLSVLLLYPCLELAYRCGG